MIKKIFLGLIIITVLYVMGVFLFPDVSAKIDSFLRIPGFSDTIRGKKEVLDTSITNIPNKQEIQSGATDAKNIFIDGVKVTKDKIDDIRTKTQEAKEFTDSSIETYNQAKDVYLSAQEKLDKMQEMIDIAEKNKASGTVDIKK